MERVYATLVPSDLNMATILPYEIIHTPIPEVLNSGSFATTCFSYFRAAVSFVLVWA